LTKFGRIKEERLLVVQDLGIQLSTVYWTGKVNNTFIDKEEIQDIILNEFISCHRVFVSLNIIVRGRSKMSLAFKHMFPRFQYILTVYRGVRAVMYKEAEEAGGKGPSDDSVPVISSVTLPATWYVPPLLPTGKSSRRADAT
jgi:hypothetical protein